MMNTLNTENPIEKPFRKTGDPVDLTSESPLHPRRKSRRIMVGPVPVGGGAPISVQSMTNTLTANVPATLQQIAELTAAGCDIVRVAVPSQDDADALPEICRKSPIPVIADIHFQSKYVFQAIDAGCAAVRVNPGNIRKFDEVGPDICKAATDAGHLAAYRRERRLAGQGTLRQIRWPDSGSAGGLRLEGSAHVRGRRLPRFQDLRQTP